MERKYVITIAGLILLALAAWALASRLRATHVDPVVAEQFQWKITDKAVPAGQDPQNDVALSVAGVVVPIGTYMGSCNLVDNDRVPLLAGEVSGVICTLHGAGQEMGIFSDGDKLSLRQGVASTTSSGLTRTGFVELKKL